MLEGGDIYDCLSNRDIDGPLQLLLGPRAIEAISFYEVRITAELHLPGAERLARDLSAKLNERTTQLG